DRPSDPRAKSVGDELRLVEAAWAAPPCPQRYGNQQVDLQRPAVERFGRQISQQRGALPDAPILEVVDRSPGDALEEAGRPTAIQSQRLSAAAMADARQAGR